VIRNYEGQRERGVGVVGGGGEYLIKHGRTGHESGSYKARMVLGRKRREGRRVYRIRRRTIGRWRWNFERRVVSD
jgi:hypothetical protein